MKITRNQLRQIIKEVIDDLPKGVITKVHGKMPPELSDDEFAIEERVGGGDAFDEPLPHQKQPGDVVIDLTSVLPPLLLKKLNSGEIAQQEFNQIKSAFKIVRDFLGSVERF